MTPQLLIHVGLHKTGSTWLQKRIFEAKHGREIAYCGDVARIHGQFILPDSEDYDPEAPRRVFAPLLAQAAEAGHLAVLSDEALAGRPFHAKYQREIHAARLAAAFPAAKILITIREQRRIVYSMYGQYLRFGYTSSLQDFLAVPPPGFLHPILDRRYYDYARMIRTYERHFPAENILVVPMEWMIDDPDGVLRFLTERTGVVLSAIGAEQTSRIENPAWSDLAYAALRQANRLVSQDSRGFGRVSRFNPNAIAYWVDRLTPDPWRRSMRAARMALIDEALGDSYAASNRAVSGRIAKDLAAYGYKVGPPA